MYVSVTSAYLGLVIVLVYLVKPCDYKVFKIFKLVAICGGCLGIRLKLFCHPHLFGGDVI